VIAAGSRVSNFTASGQTTSYQNVTRQVTEQQKKARRQRPVQMIGRT
jgi:hypothetical protein